MKTIWKFRLALVNDQGILMPCGAEILSVANQDGKLCIWAIVDPSKESESRHIEIVGTDHPLPCDMGVDRRFIGTALADVFVWHVFERL